MIENDFKKNFPSLEGKEYKWVNCIGQKERPEGFSCQQCGTNHTLTFEYMKELLENHCLDKAIVERDYIKKEDVKRIISRVKVEARLAGTDSDMAYNMELANAIDLFKENLMRELGL